MNEYEIRGFYRPHFFSIYLNGSFDIEFQNLSQEDLGTFVHEYTHYLQNVTTIFGLKNSIFFFNYLYQVKKYINKSNELTIPLQNIPFSQVIMNGKSVFDKYYGTVESSNPNYDSIKIILKKISKNGSSYTTVNFNFIKDDRVVKEIELGNLSVKEGMARLVQLHYDTKAHHPTIPYKCVELLAEIVNPEILADKRKLIALCLVALNSQNCALTLYKLLNEVKAQPELNGLEIYKKFNLEKIIVHNGENISCQDYLLQTINQFKETLNGSIILLVV
jgi:hypothetical protein